MFTPRTAAARRSVTAFFLTAAVMVSLVAATFFSCTATVANPVPRPPSLLEGTRSPHGHYGAAWDLPGKRLDWARFASDDNDAYVNSLNLEYDNAANYLIRLKDGKVLSVIEGAHHWRAGSRRLNHSDLGVYWSPDERAALACWDGEWCFNEVTLLRLSSTGAIVRQKRIGNQIRRDARRAAESQYPAAYRQFAKRYARFVSENPGYAKLFVTEVSNVRLSSAATLSLDAGLLIPKQEGTMFTAHLTYQVTPNATVRLLRATVTKSPEGTSASPP